MINEVTHILSHFDKSDFGDFDRELWKSRFYGDTIVMYYDNRYIPIETIFDIAASGKCVKLSDMKTF